MESIKKGMQGEKCTPVHNITPGLAVKSLTSFSIFETNPTFSLMCEEVWEPCLKK